MELKTQPIDDNAICNRLRELILEDNVLEDYYHKRSNGDYHRKENIISFQLSLKEDEAIRRVKQILERLADELEEIDGNNQKKADDLRVMSDGILGFIDDPLEKRNTPEPEKKLFRIYFSPKQMTLSYVYPEQTIICDPTNPDL